MNSSNTEGTFDTAKGKVKQALGEATNDQSLANSGAADQVKGHAEQTWGNIKDTASDVKDHAAASTEAHEQTEGHSLREKLTSTAANVKDSVSRGLEHLEEKVHKN